MSWTLRKRTPSEPFATGAQIRILMGEFGSGDPISGIAEVDARNALYRYHEGDLFTPGAGNFVFEPGYELPLVTVWGKGFIRNPNVFNPLQNPQVWSQPNVNNNGIGGLIAGDMELQGLLNPENEGSPFSGDFTYTPGDK